MRHFFYAHGEIKNDHILQKYLKEATAKPSEEHPYPFYESIYDMTDTIYDRRLEKEDEELNELTPETIFADRTDIPADFKQKLQADEKYPRIKALEILWHYVEYSTKNPSDNSEVTTVLYHLVKGNIALRISECYFEYYNFEYSKKWGDYANDHLWRGKNLAVRLRNTPEIKNNTAIPIDLYLRLLKLNLAKYYRDYALRYRRSDFDAAVDEFNHVRERAGKTLSTVTSSSVRRQYSLIWMEAILNVSIIYRYKYQFNTAHHETLLLFDALADQLSRVNTEYQNTVQKIQETVKTINQDKISENEQNPQSISFKQDIQDCALCHLVNNGTNYDIKRYFLLILLELSRIECEQHTPKSYENAIRISILADVWSARMDELEESRHNIDAINIFSRCLRKYIKFANNDMDLTILSQNINTHTDSDKNSDTDTFYYSSFLKHNGTGQVIDLSSLLQTLNGNKGNFISETEVVKWYCLYLEKPRNVLEAVSSSTFSDSVKKILENEEAKPNLTLTFLKGFWKFRLQEFDAAITLFNEVIQSKESSYIRLSTVGLKARYLLANCHMSQARFKDAEKELKYLHDTLAFAKISRTVQAGQSTNDSTDAELDPRVEIDLGYCYMQRGAYKDAIEIYEKLYGKPDGEGNMQKIIPNIKKERYIMGLNNYAACCIFSINNDKNLFTERCKMARSIFLRLQEEYPEAYQSDRQTNLLRGYYILCTGCDLETESFNMETDNVQKYAMAHEYFKIACNYDKAFVSQYYTHNDRINRNEAYYRNEVERLSVYIINLTKLYQLNINIVDTRKNIERFILGFPTTYEISLKAAMALAEWLLSYTDPWKGTCEENERKELLQQMFRSFSYITIYEERGAGVFNALKINSNFRFFKSEQRGELLAYLLAMYKPIKAIKEEYCYNLDDYDRTSQKHLVHYTSIKTLQLLLAQETTDGESEGKKKIPRLRINNCGYMNDVFEGGIFLDKIRLIANPDNKEDTKNSVEELISIYFPQLERSAENRLPIGSNVYIGSLSIKEDSFPMWAIYAQNESGCNIEFGDGFFDINSAPYYPAALRDYMISKYTDDDYPLYIVHYLKAEPISKEDLPDLGNDVHKFDIKQTQEVTQHCGTQALRNKDLYRLFAQIYERWVYLEEYTKGLLNTKLSETAEPDTADSSPNPDQQYQDDPRNIVRAFAADRINEIRFLFKDVDYEYEGEVRVVYTAISKNEDKVKLDESLDVPHVYVDVNREINNVTVRLGSRIDDATVDKYVTWLKHTQHVRQVQLARRNRYTSDSGTSII